MAVFDNTVLNGLVSGVTGNNNKAYLLMHRPGSQQISGDSSFDSLANAAAKMKTLTDIAGGRELGISGNGFSAASIDRDLKSVADVDDFIPVQVQFNPASIQMSGRSGKRSNASVGGSGENMIQQMTVPTETVMSLDLYFDDTNNKDAFMMDAELPLLSEITSAGGVVQRLEEGVSALRGKSYSVQDTTELFIAAMMEAYTRMVGFAWNKMIFWGEMIGVDVKYTMFNKQGAPIRAVVAIQIRQGETTGDAGTETEKSWEKAYQNMFKENAGNNAFGIKNSNAANWLNGNFFNLS